MNHNECKMEWIPISKKEVTQRGWDELDVIIFSGDAYVDHPSFANAVIGILEGAGYRVAIVPQPNWRTTTRLKLGKQALFWCLTCSLWTLWSKITILLPRDDAPLMPTHQTKGQICDQTTQVWYTPRYSELYPDTPILLGGISITPATHSLRLLARQTPARDALPQQCRPRLSMDWGRGLYWR